MIEYIKDNQYVMCSDNVLVEMTRDKEVMHVVSTGDPNVYKVVKGCNRTKNPDLTLNFKSMCSEVFDHHINFFKMTRNLVFKKGMDDVAQICKQVFEKDVDPDSKIRAKIMGDYEKEISQVTV